jgi:pSer/pThr/pTyr-binding forkhead associated (FHA) protein/tetratricopeptide (TPR) repeat protein
MTVRQVELVIRRPGTPDRRIVLQEGVLSIGRADDNDIVLSDIGVSRRHAKLHISDNVVEFEDNGSGNGSLFNGRRFKRQRLNDGDEIVVDPFRLQVLLAAETDEANLSTAATMKLGGLDEGFGRLELVSNHRMQRTAFELPPQGTVTLGRGEGNDIILPEPAASRVNSEIVGRDGAWLIRDRASANGTFVNGLRVREQMLRDGDKLRIGTVELKFFAPGGDGTANFFASQPEATVGTPAPAAARPEPAITRPLAKPPAHTTAPRPMPKPPASRPEPRAPLPAAPIVAESTEPAPRFFDNPTTAAGVIIGAVSIVGLVLVGGIVIAAAMYKARPDTVATKLDPTAAAQVQTLLENGKKLQAEGKNFDAAAQFYKVLQLDPGNAVGERLGYYACADIAFGQMRTSLPAAPPAAAVAAAPAAPAAAAPSAARTAQTAARVAPARTSQVAEPRPSAAARTAAPAAAVPNLASQYERGQSMADNGDYVGAIKQWQAVMAQDPDQVTPEYYQAQSSIQSAKDGMKTEGSRHYQAAMKALSAKQWGTGRQELELAVAADPYNSAARSKLAEVQSELSVQAQDIYKEARILEDIDKTTEATRMYKQVVALVGEKDELGAKAKRRLDALTSR